jgi:acyl-CoA synthetase (AMP-forming)/AMP-acid ligase II
MMHPVNMSVIAYSIKTASDASWQDNLYPKYLPDALIKKEFQFHMIAQTRAVGGHDATSIQPIADGSLYKSLVKWATSQPDATYIVEAETGRELPYARTLAAVNSMRQKLGSKPRCLVLALPGGIVNAIIWLSALSGGHRLVPLSPDASDEEKAWIAQKYRPDVVFVEQAQDAQGFACPQAQVILRQECDDIVEQASFCAPIELVEGQVCLTTSGTTGEPKGVLLNEHQIAWTASQVQASHQLNTQDRGLTVLPFFHVNAPVVSLCASLLAGSTVVIARRFSRRHFWTWVERYQITWASIVPTIVAILLETEKPAFLPGTLRFVRTGSAPLPATDLLAFEARFGIPVIETYGLSEAASQVVANPIPPDIHKPGSAGKPVGVALRICYPLTDKNGEALRDVARGETGEICIAGPGVIDAYQDNAGARAFQDGWFRTGDLGYLDEDGYLFIRGRLREVINRGGENIAPREVEEILKKHAAVREIAVVGRPDSIYGEVVVAYVVVEGAWNEEMKQELREYAARRLSPQKVPVDYIAVNVLPRTATGKVERRLLRAREQARVRANEVKHAARAS